MAIDFTKNPSHTRSELPLAQNTILYWPTELETAAPAWTLQTFSQYTDHGEFVVHTDHQAVKQAFQDTGPLKGPRFDRLLNWMPFLSKYVNRIETLHCAGKENLDADALSRLANSEDFVTNIFAVRTTPKTEPSDQHLHLITFGKDSKAKIVKALPEDRHFSALNKLMAIKAKETLKNEEGP